jgi:hypothetical protein
MTSFPRKSITFTAMRLCSPGWKENEIVPRIWSKASGSIWAFSARWSFS